MNNEAIAMKRLNEIAICRRRLVNPVPALVVDEPIAAFGASGRVTGLYLFQVLLLPQNSRFLKISRAL